MATVSESPEDKPNPSSPQPPLPSDFPSKSESKALEQATPWIDYAVEQALLYQKIIEQNINATIEASRSRLSEIRATSSAHFNQTINSLEDVKSQFDVYEDIVFGKVKEVINIAASHPLITSGVAVGLGFLGQDIYYITRLCAFFRAKSSYYLLLRSLLSKADIKVKELRQSIDRLKAESKKLERSASVAEEELIRGKTKLRQAGKQIQSVIHSAYKIERQAAGLKDILGELPRREASRFRSQVSNLASEAKRERNALAEEVSKISNHGIAV